MYLLQVLTIIYNLYKKYYVRVLWGLETDLAIYKFLLTKRYTERIKFVSRVSTVLMSFLLTLLTKINIRLKKKITYYIGSN